MSHLWICLQPRITSWWWLRFRIFPIKFVIFKIRTTKQAINILSSKHAIVGWVAHSPWYWRGLSQCYSCCPRKKSHFRPCKLFIQTNVMRRRERKWVPVLCVDFCWRKRYDGRYDEETALAFSCFLHSFYSYLFTTVVVVTVPDASSQFNYLNSCSNNHFLYSLMGKARYTFFVNCFCFLQCPLTNYRYYYELRMSI